MQNLGAEASLDLGCFLGDMELGLPRAAHSVWCSDEGWEWLLSRAAAPATIMQAFPRPTDRLNAEYGSQPCSLSGKCEIKCPRELDICLGRWL